ncbi:MAG: DUF1566 domain-containing protein [Deltaproteobacteria bacterium]|nr:DUF1566 domain-containing protein [Deltaproteobacteria bacterium]
MSLEEIVGFLSVTENGPSHELIAELIREFGLNFVPTESIKQELKDKKASDEILAAIWSKDVYVIFNTVPLGGTIVIKDMVGKSIEIYETGKYKYKLEKEKEYQFTASLEGYKESADTFIAKENETHNIPLEIDWVSVIIKAYPSDADIKITANSVGAQESEEMGNNVFKLQRGKEYNVTVSKQGYLKKDDSIKVSKNNESFPFTLEIDWVSVVFKIDQPGARIKITAKSVGAQESEEMGNNVFKLQRGKEYNVTVSKQGYLKKDDNIKASKNNESFPFTLEIDWISVNFKTSPLDAGITITPKQGGKIREESRNRYKVQRGKKYLVTAVAKGYRKFEKVFTAVRITEDIKLQPFLRSEYGQVSMSQILKLPFFQFTGERFGTPGNCGYFGDKEGKYRHDYRPQSFNGDRVVTDYATGLMWHQSGSEKFNNWKEAKDWVKDLKYAGHHDWRLPTVEEAISLLEPECDNIVKMFIHKYFDTKQIRIWTDDTEEETQKIWYVHFKKSFKNPTGYVDSKETEDTKIIKHLFIRPVR